MFFLRRTGFFALCVAAVFSLHHPQSIAQVQAATTGAQTVSARSFPAAPVGGVPAPSLEEQGDLLMARGAYAAALDVLQQVQPRTAIVWNKIGIAYHHLFALDEALNSYKKAVELNPRYSEAYNNLGAVYYGKKEYSVAEKAYKRALKMQPRAAGTYSNLGTLYFAQSKYKKGVKAYQRAYEMNPEIFNRERRQAIAEPASRAQRMATAFYLAEVYASAGRQDEALASLRRALSDGFSDRKRLMEDRELASLRITPEFHKLMVDEHME